MLCMGYDLRAAGTIRQDFPEGRDRHIADQYDDAEDMSGFENFVQLRLPFVNFDARAFSCVPLTGPGVCVNAPLTTF